MGRYKKLLSNTVILGIGTFSSKLLVFLMMPFYTRWLMPAEFSTADLIAQTANLLIPLACIGIVDGIFRFTLDGEGERKKTFTSGLFVLFISSVIFTAFAVVFNLISNHDEINSYVALVAGYVIAANFHSAIVQYIRAKGNTVLFAVGGIIGTVLTIGFNVLFLFAFDMGVVGYVLSVVVADVVVSVILFGFGRLYRDIDLGQIEGEKIKEMLKYSIPMIPTTVFWWITSVSDRYMVTAMKGSEINGLYTAAYKIPTLLTLVCMVFIEAWQFSAVDEKDEGERKSFFTTVFGAYQGAMFIAASGLILFSKLATRLLLAENYFESWKFIPVLAVAMTYSSLVTFMGSVYLVKKKSVMSFVTSAIGALVNVGLNLLLIPVLSANGAAIATAASYMLVMVIRSANARKYVKFNMGVLRLVFNTLVVIGQGVVMILEIRYWIPVEILLFALLAAVNGRAIFKGFLNIIKKEKKI